MVCAFLYGTVVLLGTDPTDAARNLLPVRVVYLLGIGLAAGIFARVVLGRAMEVAGLSVRLEQEERNRSRAHEEAVLSQIAHDFGTSLDQGSTVRTIVGSTGDLMGDLAELWLVSGDGETLLLADLAGRDDALCEAARQHAAERTPRMGEGVVGRAAATATTVLVGPEPPPVPDAGDPDGIAVLGLRSLLAVPIVGRGRVRGVLVAGSVGNAPVAEGERRLAEAIAERAGPALENAALWADLQEQVVREQEARRVKDDFLSIVSHELRTPLTSITGYAQLLERRLRDRTEDARELEQVRIIREQSGRMRRLVEDLLDVSRIDRRGAVSVEPSRSTWPRSCEAVASRTRRAFGERVEMVRDARRADDRGGSRPDRPGAHQPRRQRRQVLARRRDPSGSAPTASATRSRCASSTRGSGIPEELRDRVFDLFVQADGDALRRRFGGLGLGLYITRAIVDAHGGDGSGGAERRPAGAR